MNDQPQGWFDDAAGPVVRPYAMTRGRTGHAAEDRLDLIALVITDEEAGEDPEELAGGRLVEPEHLWILARCRAEPASVADLATGMDLPVGVVRVLIGDLLDAALVRVARPVPPAELVDEQLLRDVIAGLRAL